MLIFLLNRRPFSQRCQHVGLKVLVRDGWWEGLVGLFAGVGVGLILIFMNIIWYLKIIHPRRLVSIFQLYFVVHVRDVGEEEFGALLEGD